VHDYWNFHEYPLFRAVCYLAGALNLMGMNNAHRQQPPSVGCSLCAARWWQRCACYIINLPPFEIKSGCNLK
ncbi:MAG: hypothetical protein KDE33_16300, partial [Bacteroidetes bacterium]|nr:hypothetical protein [Bacteroidota bacterium]